MRVLCLGAGQSVGGSCFLVEIGPYRVLLDCGVHLGGSGTSRFPDFRYLEGQRLDAVVITHCHLDHCAALPVLTELVGFDGPVLMTSASRSLIRTILEDFARIVADRPGEGSFYTSSAIRRSLRGVTAVPFESTWSSGPPLSMTVSEASRHPFSPVASGAMPGLTVAHDTDPLRITLYHASHILGAAMVYIEYQGCSMLYTGDFNGQGEWHLGPARVPPSVRPRLLLTESTYSTTSRPPKILREAELFPAVESTLRSGGCALLPVFALGRTQEIAARLGRQLIDNGVSAPVYVSGGLSQFVCGMYRRHVAEASPAMDTALVQRGENPLDLERSLRVQQWDPEQWDNAPHPCVLIATPGMLAGGTSLGAFARWADQTCNLVVLTTLCAKGSVGHALWTGQSTVMVQGKEIPVRCGVRTLSLSAHADQSHLEQLVAATRPSMVALVHGEEPAMAFCRERLQERFRVPVVDPPKGVWVDVPDEPASFRVGRLSRKRERPTGRDSRRRLIPRAAADDGIAASDPYRALACESLATVLSGPAARLLAARPFDGSLTCVDPTRGARGLWELSSDGDGTTA